MEADKKKGSLSYVGLVVFFWIYKRAERYLKLKLKMLKARCTIKKKSGQQWLCSSKANKLTD